MNLIVAVDKNWAIGNKGNLLASIPEDMKNFRNTTMGNVIVLGRKTLEGFPNGLPLVGRDNIIMSTKPEFKVKGGIIVHSKEELFDKLKEFENREIFVCGGGKIYEMLVPYCKYAYVTKIDFSYEADTYFPNLDKMDNWKMVSESDEHTCFSIEYYFQKYENESPLSIK